MTTLITGAGLVGASYAQRAVERGEKVVFLDPLPRDEFIREKLGEAAFTMIRDDARSLPGLIAAIRDHGADVVLHTAGLIGRKVEEPMHFGFGLNVEGVLAVAEAVRLTGVRRLIQLSTFGAYDWRRPASGKVDEDFPLGSGAAYSNSKAAQELILEAYAGKFGFELVILRPGNVFGVGHFWGGSAGGEKVQTLLAAGIRGEVARIPSQQTMAFEYVYAKDMGRALDLAATAAELPEKPVFNVSYGRSIAFDELVETARRFFPRLEVEILPGPPPAPGKADLDVSRAAAQLGWTPEYSLEEAFADYIEDLRAHLFRNE